MEGNSQPPPTVSKHDTNGDPGKIFVGGLSKVTNADRLKEYFSKFGEIKECLVMRDPVTKNSRCFGFVTFQDAASVEEVVNSGPHVLDEQTIDPKVAIPKRPQPKAACPARIKKAKDVTEMLKLAKSGGISLLALRHIQLYVERTKDFITKTKKIFVGGLSPDTTEDDLREYFQTNYGKVVQCLLMFDATTKRHRGFGFVTLESEDVVDKICEERFHKINDKRVETKKAQPREVMNPQGRGRGRGMFGRGFGYYPQFAPFGSFPPALGYPLPGYQAAAAAANAAYTAAAQQQQHGKPPRNAERRPNFTYTYPSLSNYYSPYISAAQGDRRPQYFAEYANLSSPGLPRTSNPGRVDGQPSVDYQEYQATVNVQVNGYSPQSFAAPPSPLSRFPQATSPGPMAHDLTSYITSTNDNALGFSASSPQATSFGHPMAISLRQ